MLRLTVSCALALLAFLALAATPAHSQPYIILNDSQLVVDSIAPPVYHKRYQIYIPKATDGGQRDIRVSLTSPVGDAEVFMQTDKQTGTVGNTSWIWRGYDSGTQALVVTPGHQYFCDDCWYQIAVFAHTYSAQYRLVVTTHTNRSHVQLYRSEPINQVIPAYNSAKYFYRPHVFESPHGIRLVTSPSYGGVELFVTVINDITNGTDVIPNGFFPTNTTYTWRSYSGFGGSYLHINHTDPLYQSSCPGYQSGNYTGCLYLISVYNFRFVNISAAYSMLLTQNAYSLVNPNNPMASPDQRSTLTNHIPFLRGLPDGESEFYKTQTPQELGAEFYISVTLLSGYGVLYVSLDPTVIYPNNNTDPNNVLVWNSEAWGTHTFSIYLDRPEQLGISVSAGVMSYGNLSYTITVGMNPNTRPGRYPQRLSDGVPQHDTLMEYTQQQGDDRATVNQWRYYVFYLPANDGLTITIDKFLGDVEAYIAYQPWDPLHNYTYVFINSTNNMLALDSHGLMAYNARHTKAGRYIIGVYAEQKCDYAITVTATYTDQFLIESTPTVGHIRPHFDDYGNWSNSSQYFFLVENLVDDPLLQLGLHVIVTVLSGHVRCYVSDSNPAWMIDPSNPATYNWTQQGYDTRMSEIHVPFSQLHRGPYWIKVVASQNSTYQIIADYIPIRRVQAGLPQDSWIGVNHSHWYFIDVPGGEHSHDWMVSLVPLVGRALMFGSDLNPLTGDPNRWPQHWNDSSIDFWPMFEQPVQHIYLPNYGCTGVHGRCHYAIEVWAPLNDTRYNLISYPYNATDSNNLVNVIQHTVPQFGFSPESVDGFTPSVTRYQFFVPEDNSDIHFAVTPQYAPWGFQTFGQLWYGISRFGYPDATISGGGYGEWYSWVNEAAAMCINRSDDAFHPSMPLQNNRTEAGIYYVSVLNFGSTPAWYTVSYAVRDNQSFWSNDSSIILVNNVRQAGCAQWSWNTTEFETGYQFYRMYHNNSDESIHLSMSQDLMVYHSMNDTYPRPGRTYDEVKLSSLDIEWIEYPTAPGMHYFGATSLRGQFMVHPRIYRGSNDTSLLNQLVFGSTQQARAAPEYVIHYEFYVGGPNDNTSVSYIELQLEVLVGNPHVYVNYVPFEQWGYFPSNVSNMWNITDPNVPSLWIYPALKGRYIVSVQARSYTQAEWRISAVRHTDITSVDYLELRSSEIREQFLPHNRSQTYWIWVPTHGDDYQELRLSITSWYGDAEFFVTNVMDTTGDFWNPSYSNFIWRGYDAGTASIVINSNDPNWCKGGGCYYFINVYSNEVASYYSIVAQLHGNYSAIYLKDHVPINAITGVNSTSRFMYRPLNWQLQHGFRISTSPSYGAAMFLVNVMDVRNIQSWADYQFPTLDNYTWTSYGYFEGTFLHIHHTDDQFCRAKAWDGTDNERSSCIYLISVIETTGFVPTQYTLLLNSVVTPDQLPPDVLDGYNHLHEPHARLVNHVPIQQFAETGNVTYYKTMTLNNNSEIYVTLTTLSGWADIYISGWYRYPNNTANFFSSETANTTSFSYIIGNDNYTFNELFIAIKTYVNCTYTIVAGQYGADRLGRFPLRLTNGVPQFDTLGYIDDETDPNQWQDSREWWRYYVYYLPVNDSLSFSVQKGLGEVDLYVLGMPLSTNANNSFTQYGIPNATNYDVAVENHGIMAYQWHFAPAGRYIFAVRCSASFKCDYQISVTAYYTHTVITKDFPMVGYIRPLATPGALNNMTLNVARYLLIYPEVLTDRPLIIAITQLSGHVHAYVSCTTWDIDITNSSTYQWSQTGTRLDQIVILNPQQGPYWIHLYGWQNSTFSVLATEFIVTGLQLGLPVTAFVPQGLSHVYALTLPGGWAAHDAFFTVVPLVGRAFLYGTNITSGWSYPNVTNNDWDLVSADPYYKPQTLEIYNSFCWADRCSYLVAVHCVEDCLYTVNAFPWTTVGVSNTSIMLQHTVPQFGFTGHSLPWQPQANITHYSFHVPEENSTVTLAFTPNPLWGPNNGFFFDPLLDLRGMACVGVNGYPYIDWKARGSTNRFRFVDWCVVFDQGEYVIRIHPEDEAFNPHSRRHVNRTMAGVYYVTVFAEDNGGSVSQWGMTYTVALSVHDSISRYTNESSVVLVDTLLQVGWAPRPWENRTLPADWPKPYSWYRMYHQNVSDDIHMKLIAPDGAVDLYHSTVDPYPQWPVSDVVDMKNSAIDMEWYEWPHVNSTHYFGAIGEPGLFFLYPYLVNGPNATNVHEFLLPGKEREGRMPPGYTIYFEFRVHEWDVKEFGLAFAVLQLISDSGANYAFVNYAPFNPPWNRTSNITYPSRESNMWNITDINANEAVIYPLLPGEYLIAVHTGSQEGEGKFRIVYNLHGPNDTQDAQHLRNNEVVPKFLPANKIQLYSFDTPNAHADHETVRIALTSWYGEAEFFVHTNITALWNGEYLWRTYDAGSSALIIYEDDHHWWCHRDGPFPHNGSQPDPGSDPDMEGCTYYIAVYANEVSALYDIVASYDVQRNVPRPDRNITQLPPSSFITLTNHVPLTYVTGQDAVQRFMFRPLNYQLRHGIRIHTTPSYGMAQFAVNSVLASEVYEDNFPWPDFNNSWFSEGFTQGSWVHIRPSDPNFCNSSTPWGGDLELSNCLYLITVFGPWDRDDGHNHGGHDHNPFPEQTLYTILASTVTVDAELNKTIPVGTGLFDDYSPHIRLVNNIPLNQYQMNGTVEYYKFWTNDLATESVLSLTTLSGWAQFFVGDVSLPYPSPANNLWNTVDANVSVLQFKQDWSQWGDVLFIAVYANTNVTYTMTLSQYPDTRLGRFPIRLTDGVPQVDTLAEYRQNGTVGLSHWRHYVFYLPEDDDALTLTINKYMGEVDVYILRDEFPLYIDSRNFQPFRIANDTLYDHRLADHALDVYNMPLPHRGRYSIAVHAHDRADYAISVTAANTPSVLLKDTPIVGYIKPYNLTFGHGSHEQTFTYNYSWYVIDIPSVWERDLLIQVTELSGHVDVYVFEFDPRLGPFNSTQYLNKSTHSTQLEAIVIPREQLRIGQYWVFVVAADDSTYTVLATDFYYAQIQLGLPQSSWIRGGDSQVYGITVPGGYQRHDTFISAVAILGRVALYGANVTRGFKYPNHTVPGSWDYDTTDDPVTSVTTLVLPTYSENCMTARCSYLIEVFCLMNSSHYCRYDLNAFSWNTSDVSNSTINLRHNMPQPAFTGADFLIGLQGYTHLSFHVQLDHSNVSLFFTSFISDYPLPMAVSRFQYPTDPLGSDAEWTNFNSAGVPGVPGIYFDWTDDRFATTINNRTQAGGYYMTVWNQGFQSNMYTITANVVNDYTRGTNYSAIILVDGLPQSVVLGRRQSHLLYLFPISQQALSEPLHGVNLNIAGDTVSMTDIYVTWNGLVPTPNNYQAARMAEDIDNDLFLLNGFGQGGCDNHQGDCLYLISVYNRVGGNATNFDQFQLTATQSAFQLAISGETYIGAVSVGYPNNYTIPVTGMEAFENFDLTVNIQPTNLWCHVYASVAQGTYPTFDPLSRNTTQYIEGIRTLRIFNATRGLWYVSVWSPDDQVCAYSIVISIGLVRLQEGYPFGDISPSAALARNINETFTFYTFRPGNVIDDLVFQVDALSTDSRMNLYVNRWNASRPWDFNPDPQSWPFHSRWYENNTQILSNTITVGNPGIPDPWGELVYVIAVECRRESWGFCGFEVVAQLTHSTRFLTDGITVLAPKMMTDNVTYYRAFAVPDPAYPNGWSLTIGKESGRVSVYVSTTDRRPGPNSYNYTASMDDFSRSLRIWVPYTDLLKNAGGYVFIAVVARTDYSQYTIVSSLSATFILSDIEADGYCDENTDQLFLINVDTVRYRPITFTLNHMRPAWYNNHSRALLTHVSDARMADRNLHTWSFNLALNNTFLIDALDADLFNCTGNWRGCVLAINVSRCETATEFLLTVSAGDEPSLLTENEGRTVDLYNPDQVNATAGLARALYQLTTSTPSVLNVYVDDCVGQSFIYLNTPADELYPTSGDHDYSGVVPRARQTVKVLKKDIVPGGNYKINVEAQQGGHNQFFLYVNTNATVVSPSMVGLLAVTGGDTTVDVTIPYGTATSDTNSLYFSVFYTEYAVDKVMYTRCGLEQRTRAGTWTTAQLQAMDSANTGSAKITITGLDNGKQYAVAVLLQDERWYYPFDYYVAGPIPVNTNPAGGGKESEETGPIILGVTLPITLILAGVAFYLYIRNRKLQQELSVELPDVSATPSSAAARRRAQRSGDASSDSFSRGGGDMYSSLLGEDESVEDSRRGRNGRSKKGKSKTNGSTSGDGDESEVPYRSDVI